MKKRRGHGGKPKGTIVRAGGVNGPQVVRSTGRQWSDEAAAIFLNSLAATCNVRLSVAEAGFTAPTVYSRRRDDAAFAARWQAALEQGYARIEAGLVRAAGDALEGFAPDADTPIPTMSAADALAVLRFHRDTVRNGEFGSGRGRRRRPPRPLADLTESILLKLDALESVRGDA